MQRKSIICRIGVGLLSVALAVCMLFVNTLPTFEPVIDPITTNVTDKGQEDVSTDVDTLSSTQKGEISAENMALADDDIASLVTEDDTLRDYTEENDSKHAYDPFAEMENEEATKEYRESVDYVQGTIIYKVTETARRSGGYEDAVKASDLTEIGIDTTTATELSRKETEEGSGEFEVIYQADIDGDVWEAVDKLADTKGVLAAQPSYLYEDTAMDVPTITHNPHFDNHWHHHHMHFDKIWDDLHKEDITAGEGSIVAVIDTGVDYTHPDLAANMWVNSAEKNGKAGVDDDGNGYVDDIYGASTVGAKTYHSGNPDDDQGHGTHVAGIIAMTANNDEGGVGVAYGSKIMAIKAGKADGTFADTDVAEAINYAVAMGADVINMSFSGTGQSILVEEALADAFGTCVLVAAAGNDSMPTSDAPDEFVHKADFYPAGYSYVLGVMASDENNQLASFSNWDYVDNGGSAEYEMIAPGVDIYSTLPDGKYAYWNGTSMAAPMVSAAASLIRSKYSDKSAYSSRFIMGQLASATDSTVTYTDQIGKSHTYGLLDMEDSITKFPTPNITLQNAYLFDNTDIDPANDGDGIMDAGETIDFGLVLRNQWGMASDVTVTVNALSSNGVENPYVEFITDTITMDNIGTFNEQDNSFTYNGQQITGTANPIRFKISKKAINDAAIVLNINVTCKNGMDAEDTTVYTVDDSISFYVQRGRSISGRIEEDMTLTSDYYWIVDGTVYIPEGVTVTVEEGTQMQFWPSNFDNTSMVYIDCDGEFLVDGTEENPVAMFPSAAFKYYGVEISGGLVAGRLFTQTTTGKTQLSYVDVINPSLKINYGDHLNVVQNTDYYRYRYLYDGVVKDQINTFPVIVNQISDSRFVALRSAYYSIVSRMSVYGYFKNVLFDNCEIQAENYNNSDIFKFENCTFDGAEKDGNLITNAGSFSKPTVSFKTETYSYGNSKYVIITSTYKNLYGDLASYYFANELAKQRGGHLAVVNSDEEKEFIGNLTNTAKLYVTLGGCKKPGSDTLEWIDGSTDYTHTGGIFDYYAFGCSIPSYSLSTAKIQNNFIFEFPDTVSDETILKKYTLQDVVYAEQKIQEDITSEQYFKNNAVLNNLYDTDTTKWTRLDTTYDNNYVINARYNYWGTTNEDLIKAQAIDTDHYVTYADILTDLYLTLDSPELETIYPFVTEAFITDADGNRLNSCGKQEIQLHVKFNRDMDTSVQPMVSFGPAEPYTDYVVNGDWVDARHWKGTYKVTAIIDAGNEYIRIKNAVAADDGWLTTGTDEARFMFDISSTGAAALTMQATGGENKVDLSWSQTDYETLAGFNVYRSTSAKGAFTKINSKLVPGTIREYTDKNVTPGVEYFYYFTVVGTDMEESSPSNIASATPVDNIKPVLNHTRVTKANYGEAIAFNATASDNIGLEYINLYFRAVGDTAYQSIAMSNISGNDYYAMIPASSVSADGMEYYIEVSDGVSIVRDGSASYPVAITVDSSMVIYSVSPSKVDTAKVADGITAIVTGVNFFDEMTLTVGGKETEFTVISDTQLSFTIPEGNIGRADIVITRGDATAQLTNAITYTDASSEAQIIATGEAKAKEAIKLPILITATGDVIAADIQLKLTKSLFSTIKFEKSENLSGAISSCTSTYDGIVKISVATAIAMDLSQPIGYLVLTPNTVTEAQSTAIEMTSVLVNAVAVETLVDCNLVIKPNFSVSGKVTYYNSSTAMEGVKITLSNGMVTYTDASGYYSFTGITENEVFITPEFSGNVNGAISAQDASLVLQATTEDGSTLTDYQMLAADVDGDGTLTALDAAYILQKDIGIIEGNYPGSGAEWVFSDKVKTLKLTANATNVNFTGILLGDVTGDWNPNPEEELE